MSHGNSAVLSTRRIPRTEEEGGCANRQITFSLTGRSGVVVVAAKRRETIGRGDEKWSGKKRVKGVGSSGRAVEGDVE